MAKVTRSISLEDWEEKTRLNEKQLQSVYEVKETCTELPLPSSWYFNDKSLGSPSAGKTFSSGGLTPDASTSPLLNPLNAGVLSSHLRAINRSRSATNLYVESTTAAEKQSANDIGTDKPIETLQQFFDWFAIMEKEMEKGQEDIYRDHLSIVSFYKEVCDEFLNDLQSTKKLFDDLRNDYGFVEKQTKSLQTTCEELLEEQHQLTQLADALTERLQYFNQLEPIAKVFNAPGDDICLKPDFIPMLEKLDECITYMNDHLNYRDSELYLMRFRQCLTRAMTLIKMYAISTIKTLGYETYKQIMSKNADPTMTLSKQTTIFNVKFRTIAPTIKNLADEVEKRGRGHTEYMTLYKEIISVYIQTRQQVLSPIISRKIMELSPNGSNLLTFARNGCAYIMGLCSDEYNLFYTFFQSGEDEIYEYLELLTSYLHDYLRPRIIHENNILVLSELCSIFQMYVLQENQLLPVTDNDASKKDVVFGHLIQDALEDAQTRLVFRSQMYIHNDIEKYQSKPEDFQLERLKGNSAPSTSILLDSNQQQQSQQQEITIGPATLNIDEDQSDTQSITPSITMTEKSTFEDPDVLLGQGLDVSKGWYPTLQKTMWILSKLYRNVQTKVFEDLAQEAISLCIETLKRASETMAVNESRLVGQLFLIKQLITLKEQLTPFEVNFVHAEKALDFSSVTDTLNSFPTTRSLLFNRK
ncbi:Sec34-like family-domain-containing protein [Cunninghamella echinulata]|nr:Sec34-like family-domain-containing protein [Cunninghamella echinulata]